MEEGLDGSGKIWPCLRISSWWTSSSQVPCGFNCPPPPHPPLQISQCKNCNSHSVPRQNSDLQHIQTNLTKHNFFFFLFTLSTHCFDQLFSPSSGSNVHTHTHTHTHKTHTVTAGTQTGAADLSPQDGAQSTASMSV